MRILGIICSVFLLINNSFAQITAGAQMVKPYALVIHGGAGTLTPDGLSEEMKKKYEEGLERALSAGEKILVEGGSAMDAVEAAIIVLENDSNFNAGRGAVLNNEGAAELDASVMDGSDLNAGAVAGVKDIKNPIKAARAVMEKSPHVMFNGYGASVFAKENGLEMVDPEYFVTERKKRVQKKTQKKTESNADDKHGTVGAVALDKNGNIAAGTSTGGMNNKKAGRIGDSPIIGAGTYAANGVCGVSCTGWGEYYIRLVMAKSIADRMELLGISMGSAVDVMIHDKLEKMKATGGVIAVDMYGNVVTDFNTESMLRAWVRSNGERKVLIFK